MVISTILTLFPMSSSLSIYQWAIAWQTRTRETANTYLQLDKLQSIYRFVTSFKVVIIHITDTSTYQLGMMTLHPTLEVDHCSFNTNGNLLATNDNKVQKETNSVNLNLHPLCLGDPMSFHPAPIKTKICKKDTQII